MISKLVRVVKRTASRYTICPVLGHVSTSTMARNQCDRCPSYFAPVYSEYLPTRSAQKEDQTERVSVGRDGLLVKLGFRTPEQVAYRLCA